MSKKSPSLELEVVAKGDFSTAIKTALKQAGDLVKIEHVAAQAQLAEDGRMAFTVHAVLTGLLLLAKKQSIAHGKFRKFCEEAMVSSQAKRVTRGPFEEGVSYRTAKRYMALAKRILLQFQEPDVRNRIGARIEALRQQGETINPGELVATVAKDEPRGLVKILTLLFEDMSLAELTTHLTESGKEADEEETKVAKGSDSSEPIAQTDFFDELGQDVDKVQSRLHDPLFLALKPAEQKAYFERVIAVAKKALDALKGNSSE